MGFSARPPLCLPDPFRRHPLLRKAVWKGKRADLPQLSQAYVLICLHRGFFFARGMGVGVGRGVFGDAPARGLGFGGGGGAVWVGRRLFARWRGFRSLARRFDRNAFLCFPMESFVLPPFPGVFPRPTPRPAFQMESGQGGFRAGTG